MEREGEAAIGDALLPWKIQKRSQVQSNNFIDYGPKAIELCVNFLTWVLWIDVVGVAASLYGCACVCV